LRKIRLRPHPHGNRAATDLDHSRLSKPVASTARRPPRP
jgi:hypothetical protein